MQHHVREVGGAFGAAQVRRLLIQLQNRKHW